MQDTQYDFGMIGLGVMGSNLLLNLAGHGFAVIGYDKDLAKTKSLESAADSPMKVKGVNTPEELASLLKAPRKIMMLVPAGKAVDSVIEELKPLLSAGDILIDGGNSHYTDTQRRLESLRNSGFHFMGIGISGGEEGARKGPSIMPGGDIRAYEEIAPLLKSVAARVHNEPCVAYLGNGAAGHYVKMVHNGIEYAIMQLISECYDLMRLGLNMTNEEIRQEFSKWNSGEMQSFLLEITADIFAKKDDLTDGYLVDNILDKAGAKGTGKWTSLEGLNLPLPIPTIDAAVMMRNLSSLVEERAQADALYRLSSLDIEISKEELLAMMHDALYFSTLMSYIQGLAMLSAASEELKMEIPIVEVVNVWRGGCIIRSALLGVFREVFQRQPGIRNLLLDADIAELVQQKLPALQKIISLAAGNNFPAAGLMASFNYFNAYRRKSLPTNLVQAQRDYFGAHTYQRNDREGIFHTDWEQPAQ